MTRDTGIDSRDRQPACLADLIRGAAAGPSAEAAILAPDRRALGHRGLAALVKSVAAQLGGVGVKAGDRVAVVLGNGPEMAVAFLGIASYATCAPLNPAYGAEEFDFYLSDLGAKAVVVEAGSDSPAVRVARARGIAVLPIVPEADAEAGRFAFAGGQAGPGGPPRFAGPDDVALVLHTSGTTSRPKIVPLTHANLCASAVHVREALGLGPGDRCLNVMPLFHIHGLVAALLASLAAGAGVACCPGFYAPEFFSWMDRCRPTWYTAVPTMHQAILARAGANRDVIARRPLRFVRSSSAALPPRVLEDLERTFGAPVVEAYGMTEAAHQIASNPVSPGARKPGTVGRAAGPRVAIMGEAGALLPPGEVGEIVIRGPNVTGGYENNPEANREAFAAGWFRTGDQGFLDGDGDLTITGRLKEIINRGGEKIAPREVDEVLLDHPAVAQAVTFAAPHPDLGEAVAAAVVLRPGGRATEAELRAFVAGRLAYFKVPSRVLLLDEVPKGPTGKLQRIGLARALGLTAAAPGPAPAGAAAGGRSGAAPRTDLEAAVARIWSEVLRIDPVGVDQDFLGLGGDSMLATRILARVRASLHVDLSLMTLFATPTVAGMAKAVARVSSAAGAGGGDVDRLVAELEGLSDEEAERLLAEEAGSGAPRTEPPFER